MKVLMAAIMQNGLMIQQLQLMVALKQKEIKEEESQRQREQEEQEEARVEEEKQKELREEEIRIMRTWSEEESRQHMEKFRGYRRDKRCRKCNWFGHMAHQCKRKEIEAKRELRGGLCENRWKPLECRVMRCDEEREMALMGVTKDWQLLGCVLLSETRMTGTNQSSVISEMGHSCMQTSRHWRGN